MNPASNLRIAVSEILPGRTLEVFRIVRSDEPEDPAPLDSLRSHYELSRQPRRVERRSTVRTPLHLTVWGDPVKLLKSIVDIQPV